MNNVNTFNEIEIYSLSIPAFEIYRKYAKQAANRTKEILERKLTAIILNSKIMSVLLVDKHVYRFGGFAIIVNERTKKIEIITWDNDKHSSRNFKHFIEGRSLKETYRALGWHWKFY